jgi:hypothetical protein
LFRRRRVSRKLSYVYNEKKERKNRRDDICVMCQVDEVSLPNEKKSIAPKDFGGIAGGSKFLENGIFIKFASDLFGIYGGESLAMKVRKKCSLCLTLLLSSFHQAASHELNGLKAYFESGTEVRERPLTRGDRAVIVCM